MAKNRLFPLYFGALFWQAQPGEDKLVRPLKNQSPNSFSATGIRSDKSNHATQDYATGIGVCCVEGRRYFACSATYPDSSHRRGSKRVMMLSRADTNGISSHNDLE
jgi:hypothetical protein